MRGHQYRLVLWEEIADTVSTWKSGYGDPKIPSWNFEPVVVPAHSTRAFYIKSSSYLYGTASSSGNRWTQYVKNTDTPSLTLCHGRGSGSTDWTTTGDYDPYMAIEYSDLGPTMSPTHSPTNYPTISAAPSISAAPTTVWTEERGIDRGEFCASCWGSYGQQFEVLPLKDMKITGLGIHMSTSSTKRIQVYMSHESFYESGNHNNVKGIWTLVQDMELKGSGYKKLTSMPDFGIPINVAAGDKISFTVIFVHGSYMRFDKGSGYGNSGTSFSEYVNEENEDIIMYEATRITDWETDWEGIHATSSKTVNKYYKFHFDGNVRYHVKNGGASINSPTAAMPMSMGEGMALGNVDDEEERVYYGDEEEEEEVPFVSGLCGKANDGCEGPGDCCDGLICYGEGRCGFPTSVSG